MRATTRIISPRIGGQVYTAAQLAKYYGFPEVQSSDQWVAIISLGGGYRQADVQAYCTKLNLSMPQIRDISVMGARNAPTGIQGGPDGENCLDIQNVIGATAGKVGILFYSAPNSGPGFAAAIAQVATDNLACACSISWGQRESGWNQRDIQLMQSALQACQTKDITVFAASGDDGSRDGGNGNAVDFPASSPLVVGCGGTSLLQKPEQAWSYGGGGYSTLFQRPDWQTIPGNARGVPDIALNADSSTGYYIICNGRPQAVGGTSAVAPMLAAWTALVTKKRLGALTPRLYQLMNKLSDVTGGSNGAFRASIGWDPCTGCGTMTAAFTEAIVGTPVPINSITFDQDVSVGNYLLIATSRLLAKGLKLEQIKAAVEAAIGQL